MAKWQIDAMLDTSLQYIEDNTTQLCVCSAQPTTYTEAITTYKLAIKVGLTGTDFTGPVDGDTSGRKTTVNTAIDMAIDSSGDATHIALCSAGTLLYVTTCTLQSLTAGGTVTSPAWDIEIADAI